MTLPEFRKTLATALLAVGFVLLPAGGGVMADGPLSADELQAEIERFEGLGAEHSRAGFPELPPGITPFAKWRRINTERLQGKEVYVFDKKVRIWKTMFCGRKADVFIELSLMDRKGNQVPFAWQQCLVDCQDGGFCGAETKLFIDISGDGYPELMIPEMGALGKMKKGFLQNPRFVFEKDIIPLWLKRAFGPELKNLATIGPRDSVAAWKDHPLTAKPEEKGGEP